MAYALLLAPSVLTYLLLAFAARRGLLRLGVLRRVLWSAMASALAGGFVGSAAGAMATAVSPTAALYRGLLAGLLAGLVGAGLCAAVERVLRD